MTDFQFYPTPPALAIRAWRKFQTHIVRVLEPSAGDGDLLANHPFEERWGRRGGPIIDCCEIDIEKHARLREQGFNVVGVDFLQYASGAHYSHILLNPPFAEGAKHALKAWDILWDGEIVAILNAETVRNPCSKERQRLVSLIESHGEVEFIANAFTVQEAERKTEVEVALVYLRKVADADEIIGDLLAEMRRDTAGKELAAGYQEANAVALPNSVIENAVIAFNAATASMRDCVFSEAKASYYASLLGDTMAARNGDIGSDKKTAKMSAEWVQEQIGKRYIELKDRAWANILRSSNVTSRLSSAAQKRLEAEFEQIKQLEFSQSNIFGFLAGLASNQGKIQIEMLCDVFDTITKYHYDNSVFYKGWKSNSKHYAGMRIKTSRFILPGHGRDSWHSSPSWDSERLLADFDKVFAMVDGQKEPALGLVQVFRERYQDIKRGERVTSSYFDVRWFPGAGTIHFYAKDKKLIDRFNRLVGRHRNWLPPEGETVPKDFWLQYEQAEKFDREVRAEIDRAHRESKGSWWNHPMNELHRPPEESAAAWEKVGGAITSVLERHGIMTGFQVEAPAKSQALLPLLDAA